MRKVLFCVAGRTGAGKTAIVKEIAKRHGLKVVQSYTTRKPRPEEIEKGLDNSDHIFISDEEFDKLQMVAFTNIDGNRYGTTSDVLMDSDIYVIDPNGLEQLRQIESEVRLVQFYIYADPKIRAERCLERGQSQVTIDQREKSEKDQFSDYEDKTEYDIIIYNNGSLEDAVNVMDQYVSVFMEKIAESKRLAEIEAATLASEEKEVSKSVETEEEHSSTLDDLDLMDCEDSASDEANAQDGEGGSDVNEPDLTHLEQRETEDPVSPELPDATSEETGDSDSEKDDLNEESEEFSLDDEEDPENDGVPEPESTEPQDGPSDTEDTEEDDDLIIYID